jgi:hypothetical protein
MSRRRTPSRHASTDVAGRDVRVGDWVRVVSVPDSVSRMPRATKRAFARAVGKTFQIEAFDGQGCAELDLTGKVGWDTIWIEPFCVQRFRRPKKQSLRFERPWRFDENSIDRAGRYVTSRSTVQRTIRIGWWSNCNRSRWVTAGTCLKTERRFTERSTVRTRPRVRSGDWNSCGGSSGSTICFSHCAWAAFD